MNDDLHITDVNTGNIKTYTTSDIAIAAFLLMKSLPMIYANKKINEKYCFVFDDRDNKAGQYVLEFFNSECYTFDFHLKKLRRLK